MEIEVLVSLLVRVAAFAGAGWLVMFALRRASGSARTLLLLSVLVGCLAIPLVAMSLPARTAPVQSEAPPLQSATPVYQSAAGRPQSGEIAKAAPPAPAPASIPWAWVALALWGAIAIALVSRLVVGAVWAGRFASKLRPQELLGRTVRLSDQALSPMTVIPGTIILPEAMAAWPQDRLEAVLAHEEVHSRRKDALWLFLSGIICALYWPVPFVWLLQRALVRAMEDSADDAVLTQNVDPITYAETLRQAAQEFRSPRFPAIAFGAKPMITSRIERILSPLANRSAIRPQAAACAGIAVLLSAGGTSYGLRPDEAPEPLPEQGKGMVQTNKGRQPTAQVEVVQVQTMGDKAVYWRPDGKKIAAKDAITRPHNLTPKPGDVVVWLRVKTDREDAMLWMPTGAGFNTNSGPSFDEDGWLYSASRIATFGKKLPEKGDLRASATISDWTDLPDFLTADMVGKGQGGKERFALKAPYHSVQWAEGQYTFDKIVDRKRVGKETPIDAWKFDVGILHGASFDNYNIAIKLKDQTQRTRRSYEHMTSNHVYDEEMRHYIVWNEGAIADLERAWMRVRASEMITIKNVAMRPKD